MLADPLFWILVLPGLLLGAYAQSRIKINIAKYSQIRTQDGITGAQVARRLLDSEGLQAVAIESTPGMLSDHYDPRSKILRLSQQVYFAPSVAAAGIAAHEAGHALQDAVDYFPLETRTHIVPLVQLASQIAPWLFIAGVMLQFTSLAWDRRSVPRGSATALRLPQRDDRGCCSSIVLFVTRRPTWLVVQRWLMGDDQCRIPFPLTFSLRCRMRSCRFSPQAAT
jgi:hypothetical protein